MNNEKNDSSAPDVEKQAMAFWAEIANGENIDWSDFNDRVRALPEPVARAVASLKYYYDRRSLEDQFVPANAGHSTRIASTSGKYEIEITSYKTDGFGGTRAAIYQKEGDGWRQLPFDVMRNYGHFPFLFIEGHATGHDLLVCGEDYQCSTVLELDTGRRRDFVPFEEVFGWGFCWGSYEYDAASQLLIVDGCIWACPWEYRFYDFSDPMEKGWPQLQVLENGEPRSIDVDNKPPLIEGNRVTVYDSSDPEQVHGERIVNARWTFERVDNTLVLRDEWVSEREQKKREERAEAERVHKEWLANFKATDPLYVLLTERSKDWPGSRDHYTFSIGVVHDSWCPTYKSPEQKEKRVGRTVVRIKGKLEAEIEWGIDAGPIQVSVTVNGVGQPARWFMEHSTVAMGEALDYVQGFLDAALSAG